MSAVLDTYFYDRERKCEFIMTLDRGALTARQIRPGNSTVRAFKWTNKKRWNIPQEWSDGEYVDRVLTSMATWLVRRGHIPGWKK